MKMFFVLLSVLGVAAQAGTGAEEKARRLSAPFVQAARLEQYANDCVAQDPGTSICILTVEAFNRALEQKEVPLREDLSEEGQGFPAQNDIDAVRGQVLLRILEEQYFTAAPIPARDKDSLSALADATVFERNQAARAALGESTLGAAYRELFPAVFRGKEESLYEVLASTDSLRLDSVRSASDAGARGAWQIVPEADLPAEALPAVRAVKSGALAGPVRVPFGYLFLREASRRRLPDVPMAAALPLLLSWTSIPAGGEPGWDKEMEEFHRQYPETCITPDTLTFRAWLLPGAEKGALSRRLNRVRMQADTANTHSVTVQDRELPRSLREDLSKFPPCRRGEALGPIPSGFGTWYLLAQEVRKGGRRLSLEESRPILRKRVYGWDGPEFLVPAIADAQAREKDIRSAITAQYLMTRKPDIGSLGNMDAAGSKDEGKAGSATPWESNRNNWMRKHLILRFVELPDPGPSCHPPRAPPSRTRPGATAPRIGDVDEADPHSSRAPILRDSYNLCMRNVADFPLERVAISGNGLDPPPFSAFQKPVFAYSVCSSQIGWECNLIDAE